MKKLLLIAFVFSWLFWAIFAAAGTYYCSNSTNSTDWNAAQTISTPCSLNTTMVNASAGDLVYFRAGNYMAPVTASSGYTPAVRPSSNGTSGNPITFEAYSGEIPFIDNSNNNNATGTVGSFGTRYVNYIVWDGFHTKVEPDSAGIGKGILLYNGHNVTIRNCMVEGNLLGNSNNACVRIDYVDNSTIENNRLYNSKEASGPTGNACGIMMYHTNDIICQNNTIWECDAGIHDKQDGSDNFHRYNHIRDCSQGFRLGTVTQATQGMEIYQNVVHDIDGTCLAIANADTSGCDGFKFYNNTFYNISAWGISLREATKVTNVEIFNNITYTATTGVRTYTGTALIIDYNDYYSVTKWNIDSYGGTDYTSLAAWQAGTGFDMNSTTADPNFVNVGGTTPEDYKLQAGSPALTLGIDRQDYDGDGNTTEVIPAGAYIDGDETIGYSTAGGNGGGNGGSTTGSRASGLSF